MTIFSNSLPLLASAEDIRPIRGMIDVPLWQTPTPWIILGVAVLLAIAAYFIIRSLLKKPPPRVLTPFEVAMNQLKEARELMEKKQDKAFSSVVSDAIRQYIEKTYQVAAPEQTTEEFLAVASQHPQLAGEPLDRLSTFLEMCDVVKFAQQTFGDDQRKTQYESAQQFLQEAEKSQKQLAHNPTTSAATQPKAAPVSAK